MANVIVGDVTSFETVDDLTNTKYDLSIHLVSLDHTDSNKDPNIVNSVNVMPIWNLLELFKKKNTLNRMIYFSTVHVYGPLPSIKFDESQWASPDSPYGLTHYFSEKICNMYNTISGIECVNLRLSNSYGSPLFANSNCWSLVVNDLCRTAFTKKKIVLKSDGSALRDFIHHKDIFGAVHQLIQSEWSQSDGTYHLSSGSTYSILELACYVKSIYYKRYGREIEISTEKSDLAPARDSKKRYIINNQKIASLGYKPLVNIESGIIELFEYLENNV
jgi:UDP-glucose 4-epimerase